MRISPTLVLLLLTAHVATAQQEERLPDLTPQEFEIRGDLQISLPDLERQPLRGFAPPPRAYVVPADRQPHVAPYAQRLDDLPDDPLAPAVPPALTGATPRVGQLDLMAGRYFGRRGRLTLNTRGFGLDALYSGYSEFSPDRTGTELADADNLRGRISYAGGDQLMYAVAADGAYHDYGLLGAYPPLMAPDLVVGPGSRRARQFGLETSVTGTPPALPFSVGLRYEASRLHDPADPAYEAAHLFPLDAAEGRLLMNGSVEAGPVSVSARTALAGPDGFIDASLIDFDAGLTAGLRFGDGLLRVGASVFGFRSEAAATDRSGVWIGPTVEFDTPVGDGARFYAWSRPGTESRGLFDVLRANPFATTRLVAEPDIHLVSAEAGLEIQSAPVMIGLFGGARISPHRLYFERPPDAPEGRALFVTRYGAANLFRGGGNITFHGPADLSLSAGLEYRRARLTEQGRAVPFFAPLAWRFSAALPFLEGRGLVQASFYGEGARPTETDGISAPPWGDLSLEAHYRLAGRFGLIARADHLGFRSEQWPGFPQPGTMITAGVRAGW